MIFFPVEILMDFQEFGGKEYVCVFARDISKRYETEKALIEFHQTLLTFIDSIDATIYVADMEDYKILFANKYMKECFNGDIIGKICYETSRKYPVLVKPLQMKN